MITLLVGSTVWQRCSRTSLSNNVGVTKTPIMLPRAELKTAAASLPPEALVTMTAEETGGGMQLRVTRLLGLFFVCIVCND